MTTTAYQPWQIADLTLAVQVGNTVFTDAPFTLTTIAPELQGLTGIRFSHEAAKAGRDPAIEFSCAAPVRVLVGYFQSDAPGWRKAPTLATELPSDSPVLTEEIFGPLLAVERVKSIEEACDRVDASPFALTGGLFSRNPRTVDYVEDRSPVGNLYVNREITGAMVGRQPFGGNRLSGTGTKAGVPGYLLHFVETRVVTENTVRHGLVV